MLNTISSRLEILHQQLQQMCQPLGRLAVALYDDKTDMLHTFVSSSEEQPLKNYQVPLDKVPSLKKLSETGECRVLNDLNVLSGSKSHHSQRVLEAGYQSSLTVPLMTQGRFLGVLFFDSYEKDSFTDGVQANLALYAQLIAEIISHDLSSIKTLKGAVLTAREFSRQRDEETAAHLSRMSHYSRLIAMELTDLYQISEEEVEYIHQFSPLHDIGKVAIPDNILLKRGNLTEDEYRVMRSHVEKGVEIIDLMIQEFELDSVRHISILRNIIDGHHERYDGSGYPRGAVGEQVPVESRIVAVADVFDALTTERPYKKAWSFEDALHFMQTEQHGMYDPACLQAIEARFDDMKMIYQRFAEEPF